MFQVHSKDHTQFKNDTNTIAIKVTVPLTSMVYLHTAEPPYSRASLIQISREHKKYPY